MSDTKHKGPVTDREIELALKLLDAKYKELDLTLMILRLSNELMIHRQGGRQDG